MKKKIVMSNAIALHSIHRLNFLVIVLIFISSFLNTFSSRKSWGGGLNAQIPTTVFNTNGTAKSLLAATNTFTVPLCFHSTFPFDISSNTRRFCYWARPVFIKRLQ